jgi:CHAD domain-containing protein
MLLEEITRSGESERVHDFRVSLRRVRSLIKLYLHESVPFPAELKSAVRSTNAIRELDVLIESIDPALFPKTLRLLGELRRKHFRKRFTGAFRNEAFCSLNLYYDALCDANLDISAEHLIATVETRYLAGVKKYGEINEKTSQEELHKLRVDFKNIRYGLEFLRAEKFADEKEKIAECKKIQNPLGAVQDAYNQVDWLRKLSRSHPNAETKRLLQERKKGLKKLKAASRSALSPAPAGSRSPG